MSKRGKRRSSAGRKRPHLGVAAAIALAAGLVAAALFIVGQEPERASSSPTAAAQAPGATVTPVAAAPILDKLKGRWMRPDGGYVLEVQDIDAAGTASATYLNPRPIHVARAEARMDGTTATLFVELRAPNYPGSTYTLRYDPQRDQLAGVYFQAATLQRFDVVFVRLR